MDVITATAEYGINVGIIAFIVIIMIPAYLFMIKWLFKLDKKIGSVRTMEEKIEKLEKKDKKMESTLDVMKTTLKSNEEMLKTIVDHFLNKGLQK